MGVDDSGNRARLALAVGLIAIAGYVDAVGFLKIGHLFVSFMSGDSTQFAVAVSASDWHGAYEAGGIVAVFVFGTFVGRSLTRLVRRRHRTVIFLAEAALLGAAMALGAHRAAVIVPMVLAMGIQNAALHRAGSVKTSLTYVTGTLVDLGEGLADALGGPGARQRWEWLPYLLLWAGLIAGAAVGAAMYRSAQLGALWVPATALIVLAAVAGE